MDWTYTHNGTVPNIYLILCFPLLLNYYLQWDNVFIHYLMLNILNSVTDSTSLLTVEYSFPVINPESRDTCSELNSSIPFNRNFIAMAHRYFFLVNMAHSSLSSSSFFFLFWSISSSSSSSSSSR